MSRSEIELTNVLLLKCSKLDVHWDYRCQLTFFLFVNTIPLTVDFVTVKPYNQRG
jgi:hypothetical protein